MDNITKKKVNECVKRTLIYNSGKKLKQPLTFCFVSNAPFDNRCQGNVNPDRAPGELNLAQERGADSNCFGCAFQKSFVYVSEALGALKARYALSAQTSAGVESYFNSSRTYQNSMNFVDNLLALTRATCYLTFNASMYEESKETLRLLRTSEMYDLITELYNFCKENNIK